MHTVYTQSGKKDTPDREALLKELSDLYGDGATHGGFSRELRPRLKRFTWRMVIDFSRMMKRCIDIIISLVAAIPCAPVFFIASIVILLDDGGPVLYRQQRVGKRGRTFTLLKFRTMAQKAETVADGLQGDNGRDTPKAFKMKHDPRITPTGRILRKYSIDELPQLWNVLKGDMSLVGPRPPLPDEVAHYTPAERMRIEIQPGLTGLWQVSGRSDLSFARQVELDVEYMQSQNISTDIMILLRTIPAVLTGKGAY